MLTKTPSNVSMRQDQFRENIGVFMKHLLWSAFLFVLLAARSAAAGPRDAEWKKVEEAINQGLPKTAIEALNPIIKGAIADEKYAEAVKAITRKIVLEGNIQGNKPEEKITRLEKEIETSPAEIKPILNTILAHWYWHYFQQNRWRFMQRTATAEAPGKDFTTWDLPRLFAEIDKQFSKALAEDKILKAIPIADYNDLLEKGTLPDSYRPTLYDFIAQEALQFYTSGEQAAARPQDVFEISANSDIFAPAEKFMAWKPDTGDTNAPALKAIQLYQQLLKFHQTDRDKSAFIDVDIARLVYGKNTAFGEEKSRRFKEAMKTISEKWNKHDLAAVALYYWADTVQEEGNLVEAHKIAQRAISDYPNSPGVNLCRNLIGEIERKSAIINTERIWNDPLPTIQVRYKNVDTIYFRAIPVDWSGFLEKRWARPDYLDDKDRKSILEKEPALEWSHKLPPTLDFKERIEEIPAPKNLKPGYYYIIASHQPNFRQKNNQLSMADVWVSDLALIIRSRERKIEGFVLWANSGEPIQGAQINAWYSDNNGRRVAADPMQTDENGFFQLSPPQNRSYVFRIRYEGHELGSHDERNAPGLYAPRPHEQTVLFTDRAIYRPGQSIQYKGICLSVDSEKDNYDVISDRAITVTFRDANGKEIEKQQHRCNDYGSFAGSFTAPRDRLMGQMHIQVTSGPHGMAYVRVEEYKRPKFQVTLDAPKTAAKLNELVSLTGHAMAYTGAAIDGAQVKFRVAREVRMPWWWGWYGWRHSIRGLGTSQEIAHGTVKTEVDGSFKIEFVAKPDLSVPEKDEPTFIYNVYADVTDNAGETRSDERTINVGYTALQALMAADEWQTEDSPVRLNITTQTLDAEPQSAQGIVKIYELNAPEKVQRPPLTYYNYNYYRHDDTNDGDPEPQPDLSQPNNWPLGKVISEKSFTTDKEGKATLEFKLKGSAYRAILETRDRFGKKVTGKLPLQVLRPKDNKLTIKIPHHIATQKFSFEPGEEFMALWGTGYDTGRAFIEIEHRHKMIERYWTKPGNTQQAIRLAITEAMRGGCILHVTQVRENRGYLTTRRIDVPWTNKNLDIKWEHFTSKLQPNQKETWTAVITFPTNAVAGDKIEKSKDGQPHQAPPRVEGAVAEMVATLYDESLDAFVPHHWMQRFGIFRQDHTTAYSTFENTAKSFSPYWNDWYQSYGVSMTYRHFPYDLTQNLWGYEFQARYKSRAVGGRSQDGVATLAAAPAAMAEERVMQKAEGYAQRDLAKDKEGKLQANKKADEAERAPGEKGTEGPDLSKVSARKNLKETAFFFPQLTSDSNGVVRMTFTMPEALTQWKFMGFAHDKNVRSGFIDGKTVTAKDLMVQPNPPRFLREGDMLEFTVKVSNQTDAPQKGKVRLTLNNALTEKSADELLGNSSPEQRFEVPARESRSFSWKLKVPDGISMLTYKAVAASDKVSDGEEGIFPVLSRRIFVTESLPLPIRGPAEKKFQFKKLLESGKSDTLRHQNLIVQMVSNPSWYAVMALPYLMEYPYECSEQVFNRLYANSLARHIVKSDPKIHRVFEQWRGTPALDSPLEKNQELKSVVLEETPWVRQAESESQARRNVGILFDDNRLDHETERAFQKLSEMQIDDGSWPWFPGGRPNDYITLYITTGFGRLRHLGVEMQMEPAIRSLNRLDGWINEIYHEILRHGRKNDNNLSPIIALYLYGRSFFLKDQAINKDCREAVDYFLNQARKYWLDLNDRQSQGHLAIALLRFDDQKTAQAIMKSMKERSVTDEELGMFWRDLEFSWWWFRAPIETQALMIEAFDEVMNDAEAVEDCKVWLLKQKQTQDWKTTKATADAVYALLLRGVKNLASDALVEVTVGGQEIKPEKVEAGTGFYEQKFTAPEIKPALGEITVKKIDQGVAWGSMHWQYLEDMTKVTPHEGTPLKLKKTLFTKKNTKRGPVIEEVKGPLNVGDELVIRIILRTDRDMEYVHMKDQRGSGLEPVNVLSHYKYQDGLAYYESTRDTASHFFIDYLPKGVYVFEYSTRVVHKGEYQTGIAEIQCMYAPEFNSHSESFTLSVK